METAHYIAGQRVDKLLTESERGPSSSTIEPASTSSIEDKLEQLTSEFAKLGMRLMEQQQPASRATGNDEPQAYWRGHQQREVSPQRVNHSEWNQGRGQESYREPGQGRKNNLL